MKRRLIPQVVLLWSMIAAPLAAAVPVPGDFFVPLDLGRVENQWKFKAGDDLLYKELLYDDKDWEQVKNLPHNWRNPAEKPYSPKGFAWYRIELDFPEKTPLRPLLFLLGPIDDADEVYFNGILIGRSGLINKLGQKPFQSSYDKKRLYPIRPGLVQMGKRNVLAIRVQASFKKYAGFDASTSTVLLGYEKNLIFDFTRSNLFLFMMSIIIITVGAYFLLLFFRRPRTWENFFFGIANCCLGMYTLFLNPMKYYIFNNFIFLKRMEYFVLFLFVFMVMDFIYFYFPRNKTRSGKIRAYMVYALNLFPLISCSMPIISDNIQLWYWWHTAIVQPVWILPLGICVWIIIENLFKKGRDAWYILFSMALAIFAIINDILVDRGIFPWRRVGHYSILVFDLTLAVILANRFVRLHKEVEDLNVNLENKVKTRTDSLNGANRELETMNTSLVTVNKKMERAQTIARLDLAMAANVQASYLPQAPLESEAWDIGYLFIPMSGVSGDFYDFYTYNNELAGVGIFDVSGHGVASGLITMLAKQILFRTFRNNYRKELNEILSHAGRLLRHEIGNIDNYLTGVILRFRDEGVEYVNAGHHDIYLKSKGSVKAVTKEDGSTITGLFLGLPDIEVTYEKLTFPVVENDYILLYTDCLVEAKHGTEEYGPERILESFRNASPGSAQEVLNHIMKDFYCFLGDQVALPDDLTIMVLRRLQV
ncbi:MAG: SpoIIE family protein phosphatase [bacterium]|nr:SpoIIE family protein phosphatase [bacterium]